MPADVMSRTLRFRRSEALELTCSWCGSGVPLPEDEFSGVCIDCGTVMFRKPLNDDGFSDRYHGWGMGKPYTPATAV